MQSKRQAREELEKLCAEFTGEIRRTAGSRVHAVCESCGARRYVDLSWALQFKPRCVKCDGDMRVEP